MFYIAVRFPNKPQCWLSTRALSGGLLEGILNHSALTAEAFEPKHVERMKQLAQSAYPESMVWPIEASTAKILPYHMRKVLNLV